jgi:5-methylcytosine-specific restriction protein A
MPYLNKRKVIPKESVHKVREVNTRNNKWAKYYGNKQWKILRNWYIQQHPLCADCILEGKSTPADEVHHVRAFSTGATEEEKFELLLDPLNLVSLCSYHHDIRHGRGKSHNVNYN